MNKYCVSYISFHDNIMKMKIYEAEYEMLALQMYCVHELGMDWDEARAYGDNVEEVANEFFNGDSMIGVIKIED